MRRAGRIGGGGAALGLAAATLVAAGVYAAAEIQLPAGPNRDLVYGACRTCHDLQYLVESAGIGRDDWDALIDSMGQYGLRIAPPERAKILDYLATYLGPHPPPAAAAAPPAPALDGAQLFATQCAPCHQPNGQGAPGAFPPLAGNRDLFRDRLFPVLVVLNGIAGAIEVEGKTYSGEMPSFAHLSDADIAALVAYMRGAWSNAALRPAGMAVIDAASVKRARAQALTPAAVRAYRSRLP
jgi:mono/diheme cytochrome c family protein